MLPTVSYRGTLTGHIAGSRSGGDRWGHVDEYPRRACAVTHVDPGDDVGGPSEAAPATAEMVPSGAVASLGVAAARAALRGVGRVHLDERYAGAACLVGDEPAELVERPGRVPCSLVASNRDPPADPLELFQGDAAFGALGDSNDCLGDRVVGVGRVPRLTARPLLEQLRGRACPLGLDLGLLTGLPAPVPVQAPPGVVVAVAGGGQIGDAPVHPEPVPRVIPLGLGDLAGGDQ